MSIMREETLLRYRRDARKFSYYPSREREVALIASHLDALERIAQLERALGLKPYRPVTDCP